jgi:hypothetical protein
MASSSKVHMEFIVESKHKKLITALKYLFTQNDDPFPKGVLPSELENSNMWQIAIGDYVKMKENKWKCHFEFLGDIDSRGSVIEIFLTWLRKQPITEMSESRHFATLYPEDGMPEFWLLGDDLNQKSVSILLEDLDKPIDDYSYIRKRFKEEVVGKNTRIYNRRDVQEAYYKADNMQYNDNFEGTEFVDNMRYATFLHSLIQHSVGASLIILNEL